MTDQLQKYCCNHEICGNELTEPKPFGTPNFCDTCQKANEQHAEQIRKAAEYDKMVEANRSLIADKAMLNDRIARLNETLELCDEQMKNSDNDYQYRITQLEAQNERLKSAIFEYVGMSCTRDELGTLTDAANESPAASLVKTQIQAVDQSAKALCTSFFYWWHNRPGSNTQDGFDEWWQKEGKTIADELLQEAAQ